MSLRWHGLGALVFVVPPLSPFVVLDEVVPAPLFLIAVVVHAALGLQALVAVSLAARSESLVAPESSFSIALLFGVPFAGFGCVGLASVPGIETDPTMLVVGATFALVIGLAFLAYGPRGLAWVSSNKELCVLGWRIHRFSQDALKSLRLRETRETHDSRYYGQRSFRPEIVARDGRVFPFGPRQSESHDAQAMIDLLCDGLATR